MASWFLIAAGLLLVACRKQAARLNEMFQRFVLQEKLAFDADTVEGYQIVIAILGALMVVMVVLGVLSLPGVLPMPFQASE
jgi:hypothetical protein